MKYIEHNDENAVIMLAHAFSNNSLIPIIGAGFTAGCLTRKSTRVPNGREFKDIMINKICSIKCYSDEQKTKLEKKRFSEVSDLFFDDSWTDTKTRQLILENNFSGVILDDEKKRFINDIKWPYIYTLNVDDAIEKSSSYNVVLPYDMALSHDSKNHQTLYKIHGDVNYELRHETSRLIFKRSDYLASLDKNKKMLELLQADYQEKNVIYIGCSLNDEMDLAFVIAKQAQEKRKQTFNIIFLSEKPDEIDQQDYVNMGINCIILYEKGKYDQIYELINKAYQRSAQNTPELAAYKKTISLLPKNNELNKNFLLTGAAQINEKSKTDTYTIPYYYGKRSLEKELISSINSNTITIIKGPRISGKTLLCYSVIHTIKDREIFIVESSSTINNHSLNKLLGQKESVIFFDSQSLDSESFIKIRKQLEHIQKNKTSIIICLNENDNDDSLLLERRAIPIGVYRLHNTFNQNELAHINEKAIDVFLPTFTQGKFIIDKIFNALRIMGEDKIISKIKPSIELYIILCVIGTKHSISGQEILSSSLNPDSVANVVKENTPFLEIQEIHRGEYYDHTSYKIVSYASSWVVAVIREFFRTKGIEWCTDNLIIFLKETYIKNRSLAISMRKFDNLNYLFSEGKGGAAGLIISLYEKLQEIEGRDPEFYVQKSKAYYNIYQGEDILLQLRKRIKELDTAQTWAKSSNSLATERNIIHIRALLWIKIMLDIATHEISEHDFSRSLNCILEATENGNNQEYSDTLLNSTSKSSLNLRKYIDKINKNITSIPFILKYKGEWTTLSKKINK
ncbi:SIR2 family protein [Aeromonas veronii]|uniref:SIR2 family protein n=1 Tax=Aeromonas sp. 604443 TaxID=2712054 RepID=UPI003A2A7DEE